MERLTNKEAEEFLNRYTTKPKYPWDEWLDINLDEWSVLAKDIDFACSLTSMRNQLYRQADKRKMRLQIVAIKAGETDEWQDWLVDDAMDQELIISQKQEYEDKKELLNDAMKILNEREKEIITARRLSEEPETLEDLSKKYKISRERIRQIETKAFEKLQKSMINASKSKNLLPAN